MEGVAGEECAGERGAAECSAPLAARSSAGSLRTQHACVSIASVGGWVGGYPDRRPSILASSTARQGCAQRRWPANAQCARGQAWQARVGTYRSDKRGRARITCHAPRLRRVGDGVVAQGLVCAAHLLTLKMSSSYPCLHKRAGADMRARCQGIWSAGIAAACVARVRGRQCHRGRAHLAEVLSERERSN